jgi:hypothetical protein
MVAQTFLSVLFFCEHTDRNGCATSIEIHAAALITSPGASLRRVSAKRWPVES